MIQTRGLKMEAADESAGLWALVMFAIELQ